jgi:ribosomal protein S21
MAKFVTESLSEWGFASLKNTKGVVIMSITRARIESKYHPKMDYRDREKCFKKMMVDFRHMLQDSGILHDMKEKQYFESNARKDRRKKRTAALKRQQDDLEKKIKKGEKVDGPFKLVRKIRLKMKAQALKKNKNRDHDGHDFDKFDE